MPEHKGSGEPLQYFQATYSALVAAFNTAMGDSSQGVGGIDPFNSDKTATEIKNTQKQQNVRDQDNQNALADALKDMMSMWMSNNKQFLFADKGMHEYLLKIIGEKDFGFFKKLGMHENSLDTEGAKMIGDILTQGDGDVSDLQLQELTQAGSMPRYPVVENPKETDPEKIKIKPKMSLDETGREASISLVPEDLQGVYDYVPDVKSMGSGAEEEFRLARKEATDLLFNNQVVLNLLQQEGVKPNAKEILTEIFEDSGTKDADRFFSEINQNDAAGQGPQDPTGVPEAMGQQGLPTPDGAPLPQEQMAQPPGF